MIKNNISKELVFEKYWEEVYKAVSYGGFDSFAHLDFPKRYYKELLYFDAFIKTIFNKMIQSSIALEINTSTLRQNLYEAMPDKCLIDIYKQVGGKSITFGSDAHTTNDLAAGYAHAKSLIDRSKLQSIVYIQRKPVLMD